MTRRFRSVSVGLAKSGQEKLLSQRDRRLLNLIRDLRFAVECEASGGAGIGTSETVSILRRADRELRAGGIEQRKRKLDAYEHKFYNTGE